MLIRKKPDLKYSEVTPQRLYLDRRRFMASTALAGGAALLGENLPGMPRPDVLQGTPLTSLAKSAFSTDEKQNSFNDATTYNNFYEFGASKSDPARNARNFKTAPWTVSVEGEVKNSRKFSMDEIIKIAPLEERIYRLRCVEAWSMVIPWIGFPFSALATLVEPTPKAKFVAFETYYSPSQMPEARYTGLDFPYVEGLRLDEAMHPLAILCVGMYGQTLPPQDGAPVRMVVPWKYGFKSIKSLVRIRFVKDQPPTSWSLANPREYAFYSNVNPEVDHPRWSQATERRIGEFLKRKTLMFNGYADQVASLYSGMNLRRYF